MLKGTGMAAGGISVHAVDVARGHPARGLRVDIYALGDREHRIAEGIIGENGLLDHPSARGEGVSAGLYEVRFAIGDYLRAQGIEKPFLDIVPFRFVIVDERAHIHLPFKFTPFGYSLFRGA
ncbi:hydroxyisourate hydrolase [Candidatus Raskinella chloraquaticus]